MTYFSILKHIFNTLQIADNRVQHKSGKLFKKSKNGTNLKSSIPDSNSERVNIIEYSIFTVTNLNNSKFHY